MMSWAFYCIKHKDFGNWRVCCRFVIFSMVWSRVWVTYIHWVVLERIMFSVMVASYEREEPRVLKQFIRLVVCKWDDIFLFSVTKVTWYFCFSQGVNSIRGHKSSLLDLRTCCRGDETIKIWNSSNVYNSKWK